MSENVVLIPVDGVTLEGELCVPERAAGLVVFAHGTGSSRLSPRNRRVAEYLRATGRLGTLLFDLLTLEEDMRYRTRFDIELLTRRLVGVSGWALEQSCCEDVSLGYFGASTGAAAALRAASQFSGRVDAVVSRGGRPDLAGDALELVGTPTLLIVGGHDFQVLELNRAAYDRLGGPRELAVIPGATHLFEEPGAIDQVAALTLDWFERYLGGCAPT
jgi:putative phosphoribosyl transferase